MTINLKKFTNKLEEHQFVNYVYKGFVPPYEFLEKTFPEFWNAYQVKPRILYLFTYDYFKNQDEEVSIVMCFFKQNKKLVFALCDEYSKIIIENKEFDSYDEMLQFLEIYLEDMKNYKSVINENFHLLFKHRLLKSGLLK